jgi:AcrR family transcriptional regulator
VSIEFSPTPPETADLGRRARRKLELRGRILEAALELFDQHGVEQTTVQAICDRADVAHKTFFNHFPSKRQLMRALAQYGLDQLLVDIEAVRKQPTSTRERIRLFFAQIADNADDAGPMHRELLTEMVHNAHESGTKGEQARQLHDAFGAIVADGLASGDLTRAHSADTLTEMLMGAFYVLMFNWANLDGYPLRAQALATAAFLADAMCEDGLSARARPTEEAR